MSTPAQSKIEFTAHLIKISSQIRNICCKGKLYNVKKGRINNVKNTSLLVGLYKWINDIYGATLPVLKNEIEDFFFARLGTGTIYSTWRYVLRNAQSEYEFIN